MTNAVVERNRKIENTVELLSLDIFCEPISEDQHEEAHTSDIFVPFRCVAFQPQHHHKIRSCYGS